MSFGEEIAEALRELRGLAIERMRALIRIDDPGALVTGAEGNVTPTMTPVYEGPGYSRYPGLAFEQSPDVAGAEVVVSRLVVRIPFPASGVGTWHTAPPIVRPGQIVTIVNDPDNPQMAGIKLRVASIDDQSQATAQRLLCEDFQSGVAS